MCQKCHLKEIPHEQQTPLEQDFISICSKICPWKKTSHFENGQFSNCHILQIGNLNHDPKYMRK